MRKISTMTVIAIGFAAALGGAQVASAQNSINRPAGAAATPDSNPGNANMNGAKMNNGMAQPMTGTAGTGMASPATGAGAGGAGMAGGTGNANGESGSNMGTTGAAPAK